jgi:hypothetical protein
MRMFGGSPSRRRPHGRRRQRPGRDHGPCRPGELRHSRLRRRVWVVTVPRLTRVAQRPGPTQSNTTRSVCRIPLRPEAKRRAAGAAPIRASKVACTKAAPAAAVPEGGVAMAPRQGVAQAQASPEFLRSTGFAASIDASSRRIRRASRFQPEPKRPVPRRSDGWRHGRRHRRRRIALSAGRSACGHNAPARRRPGCGDRVPTLRPPRRALWPPAQCADRVFVASSGGDRRHAAPISRGRGAPARGLPGARGAPTPARPPGAPPCRYGRRRWRPRGRRGR